jgi:hypothetical protein
VARMSAFNLCYSQIMIERQKNPRKQGDAGMGVAIGWFATQGYTVCVPLTDSQPYDLVVENGEGLKRVFVRTTTQLSKRGNGVYNCGLRTQGGNKSQFTIRKFDQKCADLVFIVCGDGCKFLLSSHEVKTQTTISLGKKYEKFKVF